ncbi:MAG: M48 family metalloprotease [Bacteroidota bacterium]
MKRVSYPVIAFLLLGFLMPSCAINPITGKKEFSLMSHKRELALGQQSDPGIIASFGLYEDAALQKFLEEKGTAMAKISHRPDLDFKFRILDSPVVNAFAVPGGYVYFTRGILAHFNNEAEFAGVLGHEIGHITARHSAKQFTKSTIAQIGLIAGLVLVPEFGQYANQASQGLQLLFLKFGRDHESQSDQLGVEYSTKVGYDAHHMANFFNTLSRMRDESGSERIPTFMSTHPDPADRYQKVGEMTAEWQGKSPGKSFKVNRESYLQMLNGLVYGEDPRQGYVENGRFYHPELKFQYRVPNQWKTVNSPQQVQMAPEDGKAMMIFTLGQGKTLREVAEKFVSENKLTLVESKNLQVNGMRAMALISDQYPQGAQQQQTATASSQTSVAQSPKSSKPSSNSGSSTSQSPKGPSKVGGVGSSGSSSGKTPKGDSKTSKTNSSNQGQSQGGTQVPNKGQSQTNNNNPAPNPTAGTPSLRIKTYLIEYGGLIYLFHGMAKYVDYSRYEGVFTQTMNSFNSLSDPAKINVKPDRIYVKSVKQTGSLLTALKSYQMPQDKHKELALINGLKLEDQVKKGSLIKILGE